MISEKYVDRINHLKLCVNEMLLERQATCDDNDTGVPSALWQEVVGVYSYLMNLSPNDFRNIRFHTELMNGTSLLGYWHAYPKPDPKQHAEKIGYVSATKNVPKEYWTGEPPTPCIPRPLGVIYEGHVINPNVVRYQSCISNLYFAGAFKAVTDAQTKQIIVEVGGGYGALAHGIGSILGKKATYMIIDLPEILLMSGAFLTVNNPEKQIYIYDPATFRPEFALSEILNYDFVLMPNYVLSKLCQIKQVAIMINMQSFQEMSQSQVRDYLDFFRDRARLLYLQ